MPSLKDQLRQLILGRPRHPRRMKQAPHTPPPMPFLTQPLGGPGRPNSVEEATAYLDRVTRKIDRLAEEFAGGMINRAQFQQLFEHYQNERRAVQSWMDSHVDAEGWREAVREGHSIMIRSRNSARVLGYAIYENDSGIPITTIGHFEIDPALAVPMLSAYRSAAKEIFGGELRSTQIEGGKWLAFIPGRFTTLLTVFTTEPATRQLESLEEMHHLFERANVKALQTRPVSPESLALPHQSYLGRLI